jgi:hypothetical protein
VSQCKQKTTYKVSAVGRSSQWAWINEKTLPPKEMPKEMLSGIVLPHKIQSQTRSEKWKKWKKLSFLLRNGEKLHLQILSGLSISPSYVWYFGEHAV